MFVWMCLCMCVYSDNGKILEKKAAMSNNGKLKCSIDPTKSAKCLFDICYDQGRYDCKNMGSGVVVSYGIWFDHLVNKSLDDYHISI